MLQFFAIAKWFVDDSETCSVFTSTQNNSEPDIMQMNFIFLPCDDVCCNFGK